MNTDYIASMDSTRKYNWLTALRSGNYKQGMCSLQHAGHFCCLGVLCDIIEPTLWHTHWDCIKSYDGDRYLAPSDFLDKETQKTLSNMNDSGKSFREIANWIDQHIGSK